MAKKLDVYKCEVCGNIVEVVHAGKGTLFCCGKPMTPLEEQTADAAKEKHVPVIERVDGGFKVKVGSVPHPMEEKHFIEWIELVAGLRRAEGASAPQAGEAAYRQFLKPGDAPEAVFKTDAAEAGAREYCSVHGLWKV